MLWVSWPSDGLARDRGRVLSSEAPRARGGAPVRTGGRGSAKALTTLERPVATAQAANARDLGLWDEALSPCRRTPRHRPPFLMAVWATVSWTHSIRRTCGRSHEALSGAGRP